MTNVVNDGKIGLTQRIFIEEANLKYKFGMVIQMDEILKKMDQDKRERIINSSLEEFSKNKFEKASTNTIVKNANISKGLLFRVFIFTTRCQYHIQIFRTNKK